MIVVDTNILIYLFVVGENTESVKKLLKIDSDWIAPILWRSEFRNVIATYLRNNYLDLSQAMFIIQKAEEIMHDREYAVQSKDVIKLAKVSNCSAYDCEFVALALDLNLKLVTTDKKVINSFPQIACHLRDFVE